MSARQVVLSGGPFDAALVDVESKVVNCEGEGVPEGSVARYSATRDPGVYRFRGFSKVIARIKVPGQ